jgi:hypothetical protein
MHVVIWEYEDGTRYIFETDDAGQNVKTIEGKRQLVARRCATLDILYSADAAGKAKALEMLRIGADLAATR